MRTVKELIAELQKCDPESPVYVSIDQYNKVYPVAYCEVKQVIDRQNGTDTRLLVSLPKNMRTITRREK